jgi:leucyl/phenylalanyl-tRNA--protein transferase
MTGGTGLFRSRHSLRSVLRSPLQILRILQILQRRAPECGERTPGRGSTILKQMIRWLGPSDPFPPVDAALTEPNGLLAAGGDLSPERLLDAYRRGIFPWSAEDEPMLWWSPDPRMVLFVDELRVSRSLRRRLRARALRVTADTAFADVVAGCADPRRDGDGTWITSEVAHAYGELHRLGHAHSIETWAGEELVGGLYGVSIGRMFYGESMFARASDASKVALACFARQLARWRFEMIDCQMSTSHLASLGAREIPRRQFLARLKALTAAPAVPSPWRLDDDLAAAF